MRLVVMHRNIAQTEGKRKAYELHVIFVANLPGNRPLGRPKTD